MAIKNQAEYLSRMSSSPDKFKVAKDYCPRKIKRALDVGCADGAVTRYLASLFPHINFKGIDINRSFINQARVKASAQALKNVKFELIQLRDLLERSERFGAIFFLSVLHEFYSYGEGMAAVAEAVADARELLTIDGRIIIRDMILPESSKQSLHQIKSLVSKVLIAQPTLGTYIEQFKDRYGSLDSLYKFNHFLLKSPYVDNWQYELAENYVGVTFEQYQALFDLLDLKIKRQESYLIPYLASKWVKEFNFTRSEISLLKSTGVIIVTRKQH